ncbi:Spx/MgsR family RNA polymerase-binding regulatory protein [Enterococcus hirae]|uniref:Spx/MgsR family RNA polymerase-binding regulatory protein n=1 Tax=Enterococcus hirae TaxID=1354 RepID=UPI0020740E9B|nr:Spx/MgsR family RNA polymerase-binding regulatory protein [Enterococcus hirae]EMF0203482.1 Spx/MgsR family RNA polymerase-binding regulatory protein [Enterococcus hirae]
MIDIYTKSGNLSCRSAICWLQKNKISYKERRIHTNCPLNKIELEEILLLTSNGFDDILSFRSKIYKQIKGNFDNFSYEEAMELIIKNPNILRLPIIIDRERNKVGVGFHEDDIRCFLPRHYKKVMRKDYQKSLEYYS